MKPYAMADAEADLRDALAKDGREAITRLEKVIDDLDIHKNPVAMLSAALWYAEQGLKVFPLSPGTKIPFKGSGGCLDATTDPDRIRSWWEGNPQANIGIATGHTVDVVDVDGFEGQTSRAQNWDKVFAKIDADAIGKVLTPRPGGMHIYLPTTGMPNATNIVPSVDVRGTGGYVVAPPSVNDEGSYRWLGDLDVAQLAALAAA